MTDEQWKAAVSPILSAEIYNGETYDARKLTANWDTAIFDDKLWKAAEVVHPHEPEIVWQYFPANSPGKVLDAKEIESPAAGVYIYDFGQNLSGVARIRAEGPTGH